MFDILSKRQILDGKIRENKKEKEEIVENDMSQKVNEKGELEKKVSISNEGLENVKNYGLHFGIDLTPELEEAIRNFQNNPTYENQLEFKLEVCRWMTSSKNESWSIS